MTISDLTHAAQLPEHGSDRAACAGLREELLDRGFTGPLVSPDDPDYDEVRAVWNAMVERRPALIARCRCVADVVAAVNVARERGLHPSIRGGGHAVSGSALADGGLTIDMSPMRTVTVDAGAKLVQVEAGCLLGDVDEATAPHALIVPAGIVSETGVAGLALGGGVGWFSRKHGLTCDNFSAVQIVLASGEVVEASETAHPDLFWALKGGGGNFGVVTRFTFHAHEFGPMIRVGIALYRAEHAAEVLEHYARVMPTLPNSIGWHGTFKHAMPAQPFVPAELVGERLLMMFSMWLGDAQDPEGVAFVDRLNSYGTPCHTVSMVLPFGLGMQRVLDAQSPAGRRYYIKELHMRELAPEAVQRVVDFWTSMPMEGDISIASFGGAMADVPEDATAFANRQEICWLTFQLHWAEAEHDADYMARTRAAAQSLQQWVGSGLYMNMLSPDEMDRVVEGFGGPVKYARLGRIKAKYDPSNMFRLNANIVPVFD